MRKHCFLFALTAAIAVTACGCGSVDGEPKSVSPESIMEQTTSIMSGITESDMSGESSSTPATSSEPGEKSEFPSKCRIYKQTIVKFTDEQVLDFFDAHKECGTPQKSKYWADNYHRYESEGAVGYTLDGEGIYFSTNKGSFFESVQYYLGQLDEPDEKYMSESADLDFASRDEVLETVRTELSERYGIIPDEWWAFTFSAVTKEGVEKYREQMYHDAYEPDKVYEGDELEKEKYRYEMIKDLPAEDFYYLDMRFKIDEIPLFMGGILDVGNFEAGRVVSTPFFHLVYCKNGIESIVISPAYVTDRENSQEVEIIPADQARGLIQKKYDDIITAYPPEIHDMKLFYLPIPQNDLGEYAQSFELRPYYAFFVTQTEEYEGETFTHNLAVYFDAVTGEEFATEEFGMDTDIDASDWGFDV